MNQFDKWWLQWRGIEMYTEIDPLCDAKGAWFAAMMQADKELSRLRAENAELRADAERWMNLLRGYRKAVSDVAPYFDKPLTDSNMVFWVNLNNAGATVNAAIDAARKEEQ